VEVNEDFALLEQTDPEVAAAIRGEVARQHGQLEMIASENFASRAVLAATGCVMSNKYAEGYPGKRYYGGCAQVDKVEILAQQRVKKLFAADHANVQPHSGTQANMAAYLALLSHGDKIMGLSLTHGGHLSHGHPVNFSGMFFKVVSYTVDPYTRVLNYDTL
jgi:glycine hydroxymethyltransferase